MNCGLYVKILQDVAFNQSVCIIQISIVTTLFHVDTIKVLYTIPRLIRSG